jgi:hypothetical protein
MTYLRKNDRINGITDPKWLGKDFDPQGANETTPIRLNTYLVDCLEIYEDNEFRDNLLFNTFRVDFADWPEDYFKITDKTIRMAMKTFLKDHGIYIKDVDTVSKQLFTAAQHKELPQWPSKEAEDYWTTRGEKFQSYSCPGFNQAITVARTIKTRPLDNQPLAEARPLDNQPLAETRPFDNPPLAETRPLDNQPLVETPTTSPVSTTTPRMLTDLAKMYSSNDDEKFGGEMYDILDSKVQIFTDFCEKAGIPHHLYHKAYSIMLKKRAKQFYFDRLAKENLSFDEMVNRTRDFFHTVEDRQLYIQEWRSTTFRHIIRTNPDKDLLQCFEILVTKLQQIHKGLSNIYKTDQGLAEQLLNTCQGIEACKTITMKPTSSFESVVSELRNAVGIHMRYQKSSPQQYNTIHNEQAPEFDQYWIDRQHESGRIRGHSGFQEGTRGSFRGGPRGSYNDAHEAHLSRLSPRGSSLTFLPQYKDPTKEDIARMNKRIKWQMENIDRGLTYIPIDLPTARLFVYVDGSFANNKDLSSQIGFVAFLANKKMDEGSFTMTGNLIHWSSTKCKRVTRSVLASEIYAMANGADAGISFSTTINMILAKLGIPSIPLIVCTDSLSLYECLVKLGTTKEKRLMIDIMSLRQAYERQEIFEIRWINGNDNPADAMTKSDPNKALQTFIDNNTITVRIQGSVKRNRKINDNKALNQRLL